MEIYNSLSGNIERFTPIEKNKVVIYVCGLTPYDHAHLGHARTYISFDIIKRYLTKMNYKIIHIQNITDVEDKIIKRAKESGKKPLEIAEYFQKKADAVFDELNILKADFYPKASEHIKEIIKMIEKIIENGYGYVSEDGVYFEVSKFNKYGKLSGQKLEFIKQGARIEINENKKNPEDFALWKIESGDFVFDSPWGKGRPGWHIECSAMSMKYSKNRTLDIHGGGKDLSFPHHENEIAQTEAALGISFVKYWVHTGFLTVNEEKMSKSLGNFITVEDVLKKNSPNALRLFFSLTHYRSPVDYSEDGIDAAGKSIERILRTFEKLKECKPNNKGNGREYFSNEVELFYKYMENDFDTPQALASFFELIKKINSSFEEGIDEEALKYLEKEFSDILWILGIRLDKKIEMTEKTKKAINEIAKKYMDTDNKTIEQVLDKIRELRVNLRKEKNYSKSDEIREKLKKIGIEIEDKN
ncbi:MAG: cysteine--tRNA ligase [Candidatus ainarchaeum sp.]|nr:cysteine--tRNA ligase [Candidatus ainarchaeum sp.]